MTYPNEINNPAQANWPVRFNEALKSIRALALYAENDLTTAGLVWGYFGGALSESVSVADGVTTALAASSTVYAVMHRTTGVLTHGTATTDWDNTATYGRVRRFVTGAASITSSVDWRARPGGIFDHGAAGGLQAANNLSDVANVAASRRSLGVERTALAAAGALTGAELIALSKPSATVTITAATISAAAADNSYNDSANGFVTAGFAVGQAVRVQGFTGNTANNILSGVITAAAAGKLTIGGTDGDVIVDDAAGESVTITAWESARSTTGAMVAGSDKQIQYNDGGVIGAEAGFEYDKTNNRLAVPVTKLGDGTTYNANPATGDTDPHWVEIVNNPSAGAGKQFFRMVGYAGNSGYGNNMHFERAGGTEAAPSAVPDVCYLMSMGFRGWNGTAMSASKAAFQVLTTEAWSGTANGCKFHLEVTPNGSTTRATAMDLDSTGATVVGKVQATRLIGAVVALTDAATIAINASLGNNFRVTLGGNRTLGNPTELVDGQQGLIRVKQDATGGRTLTYASMWKFPGGAPTLTPTAGATDVISWQYDATDATIMAVISKAFA